MKRLLCVVLVLFVLVVPPAGAAPVAAPGAPLANAVRVSQVYGGGGNTGATYTNDFIELFNAGTTAVNVTGWSVQYASATGTSWTKTDLSGTIQPGGYYLVQEAQGTGGSTPLPTPDATGTLAMSGTNGKVALASNATAITGKADPDVVDFVGYGSANEYEGSAAAPVLSNTTADLRAGNGCTDTDQNASDFVAGAPIPRNSASATNTCSVADTPPQVSSTIPTNGATGVSTGTTITLNFSEIVDATTDAFTVECPTGTPVTFTSNPALLANDTSSIVLTPSSALPAGTTCTVTAVAAQITDNDGTADQLDGDKNGTGGDNYVFTFTTVSADPCSDPFTPIYTIQGSGTSSPLANTTVDVEGVVVGDFQGAAGHYGFYIQDPAGDSNSATSDGVFVYVPDANAFSGVDVQVGDALHLKGTVKEYNGITEIDSLTALNKCGTGSVAATTVDLPEAVDGDLERYEGMLITFPETLTVSQNYFQGRYGQVTLSSDGRMYNPTNGQGDTVALNARRILVLDDGFSGQNPNPIPYIGVDNTLRAGDTVAGLTGTLDYGPINATAPYIYDYRLQPTQPVSFTRVNARTAAPASVGGNIKVASFNVLNYFTSWGCGDACRGANNATEFARQRAKIIAALQAVNADVVGLMEIENNGATAVGDLVAGLNSAMGAGTYAYVTAEPPPGSDAIKVAMIYKPGTVTPDGAAQNYQTTTASYNPLFDRPPLAQTFSVNSTGERFTVIVNHFKSKGSCPTSGVDLDDGQGCWNAKRTAQAAGLLDFIAALKTSTLDDDVLVIGDLNAYGAEDPINTLVAGGLVNEVGKISASTRYSYIFDGQSGYLDHGLATPSLDTQISGRTIWHINADEPSVIDYNTEFKPQDLYSADPYRASDHDPVIIGLDLIPPTAVTLSGFTAAGAAEANWPAAAGLGALGIILLAWRRRR